MSVNLTEKFKIGVVTKPHGIRGEVKVYPFTEDVDNFKKLKSVFVSKPNKSSSSKSEDIEWVKKSKNMLIVKFSSVNNPEEANLLRGYEIFVSREDASPLNGGEYYISDLIGMNVVDENDDEIGTLNDVIQTGANDVYEVKDDFGKMILIPVIDECMIGKDFEKGIIKVRLLDGLRDI